MFNYLPTYINAQFKKFFVMYAASFKTWSSVLPVIDQESQFSSMRAQLLSWLTTSQLNIVMELVEIDMSNNEVIGEAREIYVKITKAMN
jgi:hypothetical protein